MMRTVLLLLCASAISGQSDSAPPYFRSYNNIDSALHMLSNLTEIGEDRPGLKDPVRHSITVVSVIHKLTKLVGTICFDDPYNKYYMQTVDDAFVFALNRPKAAVQLMNDEVDLLLDKIAPVVDIMESVFGSACDISNICDEPVKQQVEAKNLEAEADLLVTAGMAAETFLAHSEEIENEAKKIQDIKYLLDAKDTFQPLVEQLANVYRKIHHPC